MERLLWVGAGGFIGSSLRFLVSGWVYRALPAAAFPWGTLAVNVLGCFLIGLANGLAESRGLLGPGVRLFLMIGLLGGFTTFSTFAFETVALGRDAETGRALANIGLQVGLGLIGVWAGSVAARLLLGASS